MTAMVELVTLVAAVSAATVACSHRPARSTRDPRRRTPVAFPTPSPERLTVRVLGPVEFGGTEGPLTPRQLELVVYLATHPAGVSEDQLRCALWPDQAVSRGTMRNLLCKTRHQLGRLDGELVLPMIGPDHRYRLHRDVDCDLRSLEPINEVDAAVTALGGVRGRPFDVQRGFDWAYREGLAGWAEQRIVAAAHQVAAARLAAGDPAGALTAAERGLLGVPGDEQLYRDRMLANAAAGNPAGVDRVMSELLAVLEVDDPYLVLHPDTLELYRRHGRGSAFSQR